jgi:hypothetical protein
LLTEFTVSTNGSAKVFFVINLTTLPNGQFLLDCLMVNHERLRSGSKAAISLPVLKAILMASTAAMPFDEEFYCSTYPELQDAHESGIVADLRTHFIEDGYFEGRFGTKPDVDEQFYMETYPDVAAAATKGEVKSALDHYMRAGASEGRFANADDMGTIKHWSALLGRK